MPDRVCLESLSVRDPAHGALPALALYPRGATALPVCTFLYGGGGSHELLRGLAPLLETAWHSGSLAPLLVASVRVPPFCFYLDDPPRGMFWERVIDCGLLGAVRERFAERLDGSQTAVGVSMGGYGALKVAFASPGRYRAVAAVAPMLEPSAQGDTTPLRNRYHYPAEVPQALLGRQRDLALFASDHPLARLRANARALRAAEVAIWIDAGSRDALNAHDGAEALHRELWDLDVPHEYHLLRDADHVGPTLAPRLLDAFRWVGQHARRGPTAASEDELALRAQLAPARAAALPLDPSLERTYGQLPPLAPG